MSEFCFDAQIRTKIGTSGSRQLRHADQVPAILYGGDEAPVALTLAHNKVNQAQEQESFYSQILTLNIEGKKVQAIVKDMQRHPYKPKLMHIDFLRISKGSSITTSVPLHMANEETSTGLKSGGSLVHQLNDVTIRCLPADLPEYLSVDLTNVEVGQAVHLSDIALPKGVEIPGLEAGSDNDLSVVSIQASKGVEESGGDTEENKE